MRKFKNSNLSIYNGGDNPDNNNGSLLSILGRVGLITFSMCIILLFFVYPVSFDMCFVVVNKRLDGALTESRFVFESVVEGYRATLYEQRLSGQEQTVKEYLIRVLLEHRDCVGFYHSDEYFKLQAASDKLPVRRYSDRGIGFVVWFVYSVVCFIYVGILTFFDFMLRKPVQNRNLSVYEEFALDFVFNFPKRSMIEGVSFALAVVLTYTFDAWMRI